MHKFKRHKVGAMVLIMLHFLLDYSLCYFTYNYIDSFRPYVGPSPDPTQLQHIFKTSNLDKIVFVIRLLVILDFSIQLIFLYVTAIMALVKDETESYHVLQIGVVISMITKLLISYLIM